MGYRLSKIYTRTGDKGETGLGDGSRVSKDHLRVEAFGDVDELNSVIGILIAADLPESIRSLLIRVQHDLFDLGGELCIPGHSAIRAEQVTGLEEALDEINAELKPLEEFILPGGSQSAAFCHLARAVCRRAERRTVTLGRSESISEMVVQYLNRLSDLLFVLARSLNREKGIPDILWDRSRFD